MTEAPGPLLIIPYCLTLEGLTLATAKLTVSFSPPAIVSPFLNGCISSSVAFVSLKEVSGTTAAIAAYSSAEHLVCQSLFVVSLLLKTQQPKKNNNKSDKNERQLL